jgi:hypothetical protein
MKTYFILLCLLVSCGLASATVQTAANQDKPSQLYIKSYSENRSAAFGGYNAYYYWYPYSSDNYDYIYDGEQETINEWIRYSDGQSGSAFCQQNVSEDNYENSVVGTSYNDWTGNANVTSGLTISDGVQIVSTSESDNETESENSTPPYSWSTNVVVPTWATTNSNVSVPIGYEHCSINTPLVDISYNEANDDQTINLNETYGRQAQTQLRLRTGGKATSKLRQLFGFSGITASSATPIKTGLGYQNSYSVGFLPTSFTPFDAPYAVRNSINGDYVYAGSSPVLPQNIAIGSYGNLNTNGVKYIILPDNADVDVTPYVAGVDYYTFNELPPTKYHSYFEVFVEQASPGYSILPYGPNYVGHAFWRFTTDAPNDALQHISPSLTNYLDHSYGFFPDTNNDICNNSIPGQLKSDNDNGSYNIHRKFYIGFFPDLIGGLQFMRGISAAPPAYCVTGINCVALTVFAGNAAGIWALPADQSPQNFGVTLIEMYPAPGQIIGPFDDETNIFYSPVLY